MTSLRDIRILSDPAEEALATSRGYLGLSGLHRLSDLEISALTQRLGRLNLLELKSHLGNHANAGGMHWHSWNAIKNEAVGHSSLDLTKDLTEKHGVVITAETVYNTIRNGLYYTEGSDTKQSNTKLILENGTIRAERVTMARGLQ